MKRKALIAFIALLFSSAFMLQGVADAKGTSGGGGGGGRSSSGSSGRSSSSPSKSGGSSSKTGSGSSGRKTAPPKSSSKAPSSSGRATHAPTKTGTKVQASTARNTTQPNTGAITISKNTVAGGKSYRVPGSTKTYTYSRTTYHSYYTTYRGGYLGYYPSFGSALYWTLWNDPYYYPNYFTIGSPWYQHPTPVGYSVQNGELIASHRGFPWLALLLWVLIIAAVIAGIVLFVNGRRKAAANRPYGDF